MEINKRYEVHVLEIGTDKDHVHFLIQSVPMYAPTKIVRMIKSITAREVFTRIPEGKEEVVGRGGWSDGYFINTVGKMNTKETVQKYIQNQGQNQKYDILRKDQLTLF